MTAVYDGPKLTVPRLSLITSAEEVDVTGDERWYDGFYVYVDGCPEYDTFAADLCPTPVDKEDAKQDVTNQFYVPYGIFSWDNCSSWGYQVRDYWGRATRKELVSESFLLEEQLWTDSLGLGNPNLAGDSTTVTASGFDQSPLSALATLEQELADANISRGMIHVRPRILDYLVSVHVLRREGNLWLTPMDNIVVAGRGYPGTGPAGQAVTTSTEWIYASAGIVQIRRGPVVQTPSEGDIAAAMERPNNDIIVRAERVVHAALDPNCGVFAFEVDLSDAAGI